MPAKSPNGFAAVTAAEVEQKLPKGFFVMRGHVRAAFGLSREEMTVFTEMKTVKLSTAEKSALVRAGKFVAEYPVKGGRARFVRSQVIAVARKWEGAA